MAELTGPRRRASHKTVDCDLAVIGAGPAGIAAAEHAARSGASVVLLERGKLGGTSLNTGSVPSKALIRSATLFAGMREAARLQRPAQPEPVADFQRVAVRLRRIEQRIAGYHSAERLRRAGINLLTGTARFTDRKTLLTDTHRIHFRRAVIATGARPADPQIRGLTPGTYLTSETIFSLDRLPTDLAVVGGGALGCELAQAFCRLGSRVTIIQNEATFLPGEERDAAQLLAQSMARDGVIIRLNTSVVGARSQDGVMILETETYQKKAEVSADTVLVSVGRTPNVTDLGLEAAGVTFEPEAGIRVDPYLRTSNARIYAAGDVCMEHKYTPVAERTGIMAAGNALQKGRRRRYTGLAVPWCTFCVPEIAHVGLQVWEAREHKVPVRTFTVMMQDVDRAIIDRQDIGFVKLHVTEKGDRILGATIVASRASEMINEICVAMSTGIGLRALANVMHIYPSQSSAISIAAMSLDDPLSPA